MKGITGHLKEEERKERHGESNGNDLLDTEPWSNAIIWVIFTFIGGSLVITWTGQSYILVLVSVIILCDRREITHPFSQQVLMTISFSQTFLHVYQIYTNQNWSLNYTWSMQSGLLILWYHNNNIIGQVTVYVKICTLLYCCCYCSHHLIGHSVFYSTHFITQCLSYTTLLLLP